MDFILFEWPEGVNITGIVNINLNNLKPSLLGINLDNTIEIGDFKIPNNIKSASCYNDFYYKEC